MKRVNLTIDLEENEITYSNPVTKNSFGTSGPGHAYHSWDNLTPCPKCGNDGIPYIVGKDGEDYHSGRHTESNV